MVSDVRCQGGSLACVLRRSKTDQERRGSLVSLRALDGSPMCPVQGFVAFMGVCPVGPVPLLIHEDGSFLSRFQFVQVFRQGLERLGVDPAGYSSHSFRIGAATEAARWGLSPETVRRIGRWESERYRLYVHPQLL